MVKPCGTAVAEAPCVRFSLLLFVLGCAPQANPNLGEANDLGGANDFAEPNDLSRASDLGGGDLAEANPADRITANPIVSRGRPLVSSSGASSVIDGQSTALTTLNDGQFFIGDGWAGGPGAWVGIDLATGPTRILVSWLSLGAVDSRERAPIDYHFDVSPDGATWTTALTITGNDTSAREHAIDFGGQRFVRLVVDRGDTHLVELEVYDLSRGGDDTWMVLGDSISAMSLNRWLVPDLASSIAKSAPGFSPLVIDEAIGGTNTSTALPNIDGWIARFPEVRNFIVAYGTNDGCDAGAVAPFADNLGKIVDKLQAAKKRVFIPQIPWNQQCGSMLQPLNQAIDGLRAQKGVLAGPDLYGWFAAHSSELGPDHEHPTDQGEASITRLWTQAVGPLYTK
jgi:acyl-CoA thioesterase-1